MPKQRFAPEIAGTERLCGYTFFHRGTRNTEQENTEVMRKCFWLVIMLVVLGFGRTNARAESHTFRVYVPFTMQSNLVCDVHGWCLVPPACDPTDVCTDR